jgi:16S rRNA G527 N7-methylase RsmG
MLKKQQFLRLLVEQLVHIQIKPIHEQIEVEKDREQEVD